MAVTNNSTLIEDHETAPTYTSIGGGQGAASNANFFFRGVLSSARKMSGVTKNGFWFTDATVHDISAAGTHVKMFINAITQAGFTDFWIRIGSGQSDYEEHNVGVGFYDNDAGGWIPVWVEVDAGVDTGTPLFNVADEWAVICSMNTISGNVKNFVTDQSHYSTRPVLLWDSTGGDLDDFITEELTNGVGVLKLLNGLYTCFANLAIGSSTATTFDMDGKVIAFPDATWLPSASTWMGFDIDLQNASTVITAIGGAILSGNPTGASARKPDFIVTGTSGTLDVSNRVFDGMRIVTLTVGVTADGATFSNSGLVTAAGASLVGASVLTSAVAVDASALNWDVNTDPDTDMDGMTYSKGTNAHHAIEFGTSAPLTMTLRNCDFTGFNASDAQNDSTFYFADRGSDVTWTLNLVGCTGNLTFKKARSGDTVNLVVSPVTTTITVKDIVLDTAIEGARVVLIAANGSGDFKYQQSVTSINRSGSVATVVTGAAHGLVTGDFAYIQGADQEEYNGAFEITFITTTSFSYTVSGTPTTPATGTIVFTGAMFNTLTNASGIVTDNRTLSVDQDLIGFVRHASTTPKFKTTPLTVTVDKDTGFSLLVQMIRDE